MCNNFSKANMYLPSVHPIASDNLLDCDGVKFMAFLFYCETMKNLLHFCYSHRNQNQQYSKYCTDIAHRSDTNCILPGNI